MTFISYLFSYIFWVVLAIGCLLLVMMLHCLAGGDWGIVTRRIFEAGSMTFPMMAILFVPLLLWLAGNLSVGQRGRDDGSRPRFKTKSCL